MTRASKLWFQDHHEILRGASLISLSSLCLSLLPASPRPACLPPQYSLRYPRCWPDRADTRIFRHKLPAPDWSEDRCGGFHWSLRPAGQDVSRHASLRDDSGAGTSLNSLGSLWAEAQFWVWQIRNRKGEDRREGEGTRRYSVELLLQPNFTIFHFLFTEMHSIIVSDAEPTCSIPSFLCNMAAQAR